MCNTERRNVCTCTCGTYSYQSFLFNFVCCYLFSATWYPPHFVYMCGPILSCFSGWTLSFGQVCLFMTEAILPLSCRSMHVMYSLWSRVTGVWRAVAHTCIPRADRIAVGGRTMTIGEVNLYSVCWVLKLWEARWRPTTAHSLFKFCNWAG